MSMIAAEDATTEPGAHLTSAARGLLTASEAERIRSISLDLWISYPAADEAMSEMTDLLHSEPSSRTQNILLLARSNNGKSSVARAFSRQNPCRINDDGTAHHPVVTMPMPSEPDEARFWSNLLRALEIAHRETGKTQTLMIQAYSVLRAIGCRMIIIDDIHNMLLGKVPAQKHMLGVIKQMSIELAIPMVAIGTEAARNALRTDNQLFNRFDDVILPAWSLDRQFLTLLATLEQSIPLAQPSGLASRSLAPLLLSSSDRTIGGLVKVLRKAAIAAIRDGTERITQQAIQRYAVTREAADARVAHL